MPNEFLTRSAISAQAKRTPGGMCGSGPSLIAGAAADQDTALPVGRRVFPNSAQLLGGSRERITADTSPEARRERLRRRPRPAQPASRTTDPHRSRRPRAAVSPVRRRPGPLLKYQRLEPCACSTSAAHDRCWWKAHGQRRTGFPARTSCSKRSTAATATRTRSLTSRPGSPTFIAAASNTRSEATRSTGSAANSSSQSTAGSLPTPRHRTREHGCTPKPSGRSSTA
ncbi:Uncharacterised protein [Nocardia otitidiscaviarum]|uniref:Uncharacterized protein n=1 Tax=Nocardia otitidiscaviarum TaxID=1823 RepID=A0A379JKD2_9NOCA|nr:Uncharacterised protein [Nocardia otitidiscaviarum]